RRPERQGRQMREARRAVSWRGVLCSTRSYADRERAGSALLYASLLNHPRFARAVAALRAFEHLARGFIALELPEEPCGCRGTVWAAVQDDRRVVAGRQQRRPDDGDVGGFEHRLVVGDGVDDVVSAAREEEHGPVLLLLRAGLVAAAAGRGLDGSAGF